MNDRNNTLLIGNKDEVYASPHVMKVLDVQAYDPAMMDDVSARYCDLIDKDVPAPPVVIAARPIRPERNQTRTLWQLQWEHMFPDGQGS